MALSIDQTNRITQVIDHIQTRCFPCHRSRATIFQMLINRGNELLANATSYTTTQYTAFVDAAAQAGTDIGKVV